MFSYAGASATPAELRARRTRRALSALTLVGSLCVVIAAIAGFWTVAYGPIFDPNPNGETHSYISGREVSKFEMLAVPGLVAAIFSCITMWLAAPLDSVKKRVIAAATGPAILLAGALAFILVWWIAQGFSLSFVLAAAPFFVLVVTSAVASTAGFLGAMRLSRLVAARQAGPDEH